MIYTSNENVVIIFFLGIFYFVGAIYKNVLVPCQKIQIFLET